MTCCLLWIDNKSEFVTFEKKVQKKFDKKKIFLYLQRIKK